MKKKIQILILAGIVGILAVVMPIQNAQAAEKKTTTKTAIQELPKKGTILREATTKNSYTVLSRGKTVAFQKSGNAKVNVAQVPDKVKFGKTTYKVTAVLDNAFRNSKNLRRVEIGKNVTRIGKESFFGCKGLARMEIHSVKIKKIGENAIKGINEKAVIDVPNRQKKAYKKLFKKNTGYKNSMKIK